MKVQTEIAVYERDGKECYDKMEVRSHWNRTGHDGFVVVCIDGKEYTVSAAALIEAVNRCHGFRR